MAFRDARGLGDGPPGEAYLAEDDPIPTLRRKIADQVDEKRRVLTVRATFATRSRIPRLIGHALDDDQVTEVLGGWPILVI